jgi:hypothetical protein
LPYRQIEALKIAAASAFGVLVYGNVRTFV